ncbi:MAG: DUF2059 domain-containing protein [Verrucomicrobiota bacterium]|jgi:hypothetical protein|nr:DUF2059 domain-containing protein [Verrucomicrobiota bacterium]
MKNTILILVVGLAMGVVAAGKDAEKNSPQFTKSHLAKAKEYYELVNSTPEDEKLLKDMVITMIEPLLAPFRKFPPDQYNQIKMAYTNWMFRMFKDPEWALKVQLETAKNFTEEELEGLIKFNKTPLGRKAVKTLPALMRNYQRIGKQWGTEHAPELQKEIERILKGA